MSNYIPKHELDISHDESTGVYTLSCSRCSFLRYDSHYGPEVINSGEDGVLHYKGFGEDRLDVFRKYLDGE